MKMDMSQNRSYTADLKNPCVFYPFSSWFEYELKTKNGYSYTRALIYRSDFCILKEKRSGVLISVFDV